VKLIGELIELISRRAGLDNVGEVGQSHKKTGRRWSDDTPPGRSGPSARMSPQNTKLGEGVHVRG
jgi:hypothetical protein